MNDTPQIARLEEVDIRTAWAHEALNFTPWLFANLDLLGDAIGLALDPEGSEVAVESFSADILARNRYDGSRVLIENQLEYSDHSHLGQILTYLAGLDAKTIVWIASDFREAHLSALKWLNDNTDETVSFFAVRVKVVHIAGSPLAPVFDVVARPNNWERRLHNVKNINATTSTRSEQRHAFWEAFVSRIPGEAERSGPAGYHSNRWRKIDQPPALISMYCGVKSVGLFIRAPLSVPGEKLRELLETKVNIIWEKLGVPISDSDTYFFGDDKKGDYTDSAQRDELIDWLSRRAADYERTLREVFAQEE